MKRRTFISLAGLAIAVTALMAITTLADTSTISTATSANDHLTSTIIDTTWQQNIRMSQETINGQTINYGLVGSGPPVLLWHGFLGTSYSWRKLVPLLMEEYTLIIPDMRGYGDSSKPEEGYDAKTLTEDFRGLVNELGYEQVHIIAHDMGAPPALYYTANHPDEVLSLTYLDEPLMKSDTIEAFMEFSREGHVDGLWWWPMGLAPDVPQTMIVGNEANFFRWFANHYVVSRPEDYDEALEEYLRTFRGEEGVLGALGVYREVFATMEQTDSINNVAVPILALGGAESMAERPMQMLQAVAPNLQGGVIENSGHFIQEEQPEALVARWKEFVNDNVTAQENNDN